MTDIHTDPTGTPDKKANPHILDYFLLWARNKTAVMIITAGVAGGILAYTFLMPQTFTAMATIMPPEKDKSGGLMSFLSGSGALDLMKGQENPQMDMFKNIVDSRLMSESIAKDSKVRNYFSRFDTSEKVIAFFARNSVTSEPLRNGVMNLQVDIKTHWMADDAEKDSAKYLSAHLSNLFVRQLDKFNRERLMTTAKNMRIFVEGEYNKRQLQLDTAYMNLQAFQEKNKAIALTEQLTATVTSAALIASQVQQLQMLIGVEERELNSNSNRMMMLKAQLEEAQSQLKRYDDGSVGEYSLALNNVPNLIRQLAKLTREVKMLETVGAYLRQQLEQERISEQRNVPTFQMLDSATVPEKRSSPKRGSMLILGVIVGLVVSGIYLAWKNFREHLRTNPEDHKRYLAFTGALRGKRS